MTKTNIVVIGAGFAGVAATKTLSHKLKKNKDVTITLIDKHPYLTYMTELHEVAGGRVEPDAIQYDLQKIFARSKNVNLVTDTVTNLDKENKVVRTKHGEFSYDYLVLGMGGEANDFGVPGVKENGFTLWSMEDAVKMRKHILNCVEKAAKEHDPQKRKALLTFAVCGAGFTGVELVGELMDWIPVLAHEYNLDKEDFDLYIIEAVPTILNMLDASDADKAEAFMVKRGIKVIKGNGISEVKQNSIRLADGTVIPTYSLFWTAGVKANTEAEVFGFKAARAGRLVVNENMLIDGETDIFAVGDLAYYEEPDKENRPHPQIVQAAEQTGKTAAKNIIASINNTSKVAYKGKYDGFMVSIGSHYGVAFLMGKWHLSGFFAILMKHLVNIKYFLEIFSLYYAIQYVFHEFFHIKNRRNIFRGHLSRYGNVLWSVPLRLFYGGMWTIEGLKKIFGLWGAHSWIDGTHLAFPFPWLLEPTSAASGATEAVSAASGATETAAQTATQVVSFGFNYSYGEQPAMVLEKMPDWFASIMQIMIPNVEVAHLMQKVMSFVELAIGLAIMAGFLTWIVNAVTIGLVATFCLSGMFYWVNMWFVPAAIALMNGSGRAFGLDYYFIPWFQRTAGKWWYGKSKAIYGFDKQGTQLVK